MGPVLHLAHRMMRLLFVLGLVVGASGCAALGQLGNLVQPLRFEQVDGRPPEIRLSGLSRTQPLGGANVRLWMRVINPNPFGLTLSTLDTTLLLDDRRAASGEFPLGLPLRASEESEIPLDLAIDFRDASGLVEVVRSAAGGERVDYELEGTIGIDAGSLGQPTFGPLTIVKGELGGRP